MIAHNGSPWVKAASCRLVNIVSAAFAASCLMLAGCGGGGTNAGVAPLVAEPTVNDSRATLPDAVSRSFAPNYAPAVESHGIWQGRTLKVYIPAEADEVVSAALHRWEESTGGFFQWQKVGSPSAAQVSFAATPVSEFSPGTVGKTRYTYNTGRNELISAEVKYAVSGMNIDQTRVVVHELGHVMGIHGHSDGDTDVMYPTLGLRNVITVRDLNTLFWLYRETTAGTSDASRSVGQETSVTISCGSDRD